MELRKKALQAYLDVWREHHIGFCSPPPGTGDKKWSKVLREIWPEYTSIRLDANTQSKTEANDSEKFKWCELQTTSNFWINGGRDIWYFERRDIAALFKLTFGGIER